MRLKRTMGAALAALVMTAAAGLANQGVTDTEIVLGEVEPLSGPPALLGVAHNLGVRLAIAEANAAGGVNGRRLRLVAEDDGYVSTRTIQSLRKLIAVDRVFALTAVSGSGQAIAALPVLEQSGIPAMIPIGPVTQLYEPPRPNVFVLGQAYDEGVRQLALYLADKYPGKKWGIVTQDDDYGVAVREGFNRARREKNMQVVFESVYRRGQQDFSSEMLRAKEAGVEVFIAGGIISENVAMLKEMEKLGIKPVTGIFWPGRVEAVLKLIGPASDGLYAVDYVAPLASEAGQRFMELARKHLNRFSPNRENALALCFVAFSSREPVPTSLENALAQSPFNAPVRPMVRPAGSNRTPGFMIPAGSSAAFAATRARRMRSGTSCS